MVVGVEGEAVYLSNGCICCTIRGDLLKEPLKLRRREDLPEYIIIEASGVTDPIAAANTFLLPEIRPLGRLDSIQVGVDADRILTLEEENIGLALDQIAVADIVARSKVDLFTAEELNLMSADDPWDRRSSRVGGEFPATGGWSRKEKVSISGG